MTERISTASDEKIKLWRVYVAHPLRAESKADEDKNRIRIDDICRSLSYEHDGLVFFSPVHAFSFLEDDHELALIYCKDLLSTCDELWVFGDWEKSVGCCEEVKFAESQGIPVSFIENYEVY